MGWDNETFAKWLHVSGGNIYMVRGQDGYGELNRKSRVVGFKTTDQVDEILKDYKSERVLIEPKLFGYPLAIYKITAKKGISTYLQNFFVGDVAEGAMVVNKRFPETITCTYALNGELQEEFMLSQEADTLQLDSAKILAGMNRATFECILPDSDTLRLSKDFFIKTPEAELLSNMEMDAFEQSWGNPRKNESVEHHKLTLDKEVFRYGIGSHAPSFVRYNLPRSYTKFHVTIGLDDESACGDGAAFIVLGDGRELFRSKRMYPTEKQTLELDISDVKTLELRLDEGDKEDKDCDHGDWANAWLEAR